MVNENSEPPASDAAAASALTSLRCAVVGVGRMGSHHARVYDALKESELVGIVDIDVDRAQEIAELYGTKAFASVEELLEATPVDAVTVAVPTVYHHDAASELLNRGVACLIEKPLAPNIEEAQRIVDIAEKTGTLLQVGHIERYNPTIRALKKYDDIRPRFIEVHRVSPMTFRSVDVGVVLDVMIHDLDVLLMLTGCEPTDVQAVAVSVFGKGEDVCNARLVFPNGCVANVTASRLALKTERKIRIIADDAYVSIDYAKKSGVVIQRTANEEQLAQVRKELESGCDLSDMDYTEAINVDTLDIDDHDQLELQILDFLHSVQSGAPPTVSAQAGFAAVRTAERITNASQAHADAIGV